ncbi:MAG: hypothetical protein MRY79_00760 [Alphaproteobacteria bacterium]|nr:hypothetical protein [Alphaproteobacteria bacterium]
MSKNKTSYLGYSLLAAFVAATYFTSDLGKPDFLKSAPVSKSKFEKCPDLLPYDMALPKDVYIRNKYVMKTILRGMQCARRNPSQKLPDHNIFTFTG